MPLDQVLYTAHGSATGGRTGHGRSSDGVLDLQLTTPKELGGDGATGTNPEQLFAISYAACFIGSMKFVAGQQKVALQPDTSIEAAVGIGPIPAGFGIQVALTVRAPGLDRATAQRVVDAAHQVCPYSNATRGNVDVRITLA